MKTLIGLCRWQLYLTRGAASSLPYLDAILDRAREGLRIIEEWCRFVSIALS